MSNHSIGTRMATALGLVLTLLLGAALFGIAALYRTLGTYDTTVQERVAQERAVSRMESEFKTQVLEWKNTLLRARTRASANCTGLPSRPVKSAWPRPPGRWSPI